MRHRSILPRSAHKQTTKKNIKAAAHSAKPKKKAKPCICSGCKGPTSWQSVLKSLPDYLLNYLKKAGESEHGKAIPDKELILEALSKGLIFCSSCMSKWNAIYANPGKQQDGCFSRRDIFRDEVLECRRCKQSFIYSATHQKHLIETLGLHPSVVPRYCLECGKIEKETRKLHDHILLLKEQAKDKADFQVFFELSSQYFLLGDMKKSEYYLRRAKNLALRAEKWDQFCKKFRSQSHEMQLFIVRVLKMKPDVL